MPPRDSYLDHEELKYDVVVATTAASINTGLMLYLKALGRKPPKFYCVVEKNGNPPLLITLDAFKRLSNGLDPFKIQDGQRLPPDIRNAGFLAAIKLQPGIPPGLEKGDPPKTELPSPILDLVREQLGMYFSQLTIKMEGSSGGSRYYTMKDYTQKSGEPWYVIARTSLQAADLEKDLNTPYFDMFPEDRAAIQKQLSGMRGSDFRLQQMLLDLALANRCIRIKIPNTFSEEEQEFIRNFLGPAWIQAVKEHGPPVLGIAPRAQGQDSSSIRIEDVQTVVHEGSVEPATTLDYLCTVSGNRRPVRRLPWNWLEPTSLNDASGVISIRRGAFAHYLLNQMQPHIQNMCIKPWTKTHMEYTTTFYYFGLEKGNPPDKVSIAYPGGADVLQVHYAKGAAHSTSNFWGSCEFNIDSSYGCGMFFSGNQIIIVQILYMNIFLRNRSSKASGEVINKRIEDRYTLTTDSVGKLIIVPNKNEHKEVDNSRDFREGGFIDFFMGINDLLDSVRDRSRSLVPLDLKAIPLEKLENFVFPGAKVFSYKQPVFSNYQDMTCLITYARPSVKGNSLSESNVSATTEDNEQIVEPFVNPEDTIDIDATQARLRQLMDLELMQAHVPTISFEPEPEETFESSTVGLNSFVAEVKVSDDTMPIDTALLEAEIANTSDDSPKDVTETTELMQNYVQGALVEPQGKFRALQTTGGDALLFAVNSNGALSVIGENIERSKTGWTINDLSSATLTQRFPAGTTVRQFDVGQNILDSTIGLGMSVRVDGSDKLLLSLSNAPNNVSSWAKNPRWTEWPFDAPDRPSAIHISNIYFSETKSKVQYILVDILQDPRSNVKNTIRYIINATRTSGPYWKKATLPFEIEAGTYQSCMGRTTIDITDGMYTCGLIAGSPQLGYVPIYGDGDSGPLPVRLAIPGSTPATAIASARYGDGSPVDLQGLTHFYAMAGSTLYNWAPSDHDDETQGKPLMTTDLFAGTNTLVAMTRKKITTIFGKNSNNVVYYTSCSIDRLSEPNAWSAPVPVTTDAEHITGFINIEDGGNTIFAAGANQFQRITQATGKSKLWQANRIILQAPPKSKPLPLKSYTSTVKVVGNSDLPLAAYPVTLTTQMRTPVYINGLYYVLSKVPVSVKSDSKGLVTIIQTTDGMVGTIINVQSGSKSCIINPMQSSFDKLAKFTDKNVLRNAEFCTNPKAGGVSGTPTKDRLVSSDVSDADVHAISEGMKKLKEAYVNPQAQASSLSMMEGLDDEITICSAEVEEIEGIGDTIKIAFGDLYNWFKSGLNAIIEFGQRVGSGLLEVIVRIGKSIYRAVLDTVEAVVGAIAWFFDKIKVGLNKLWSYLQMLFDWDDIKRTKEVIHKMVKLYLLNSVEGISTAQENIDAALEDMKKAVRDITGNKDYSKLGDTVTKKPTGIGSDPNAKQNSSSQMMGNHFRDQAGHMTVVGNLPASELVKSLIDDILNALSSQQDVLVKTFEQLTALAQDFNKLSILEVIKRLAGIIGETIIGTTQVVSKALLKLLYRLAKTAVGVLDTKIHIPVISDILNEIGIPDLSLLDLFTWIIAVPITVIYKAFKNKAPFPDCKGTTAILAAQDWNSFKAAFKGTGKPAFLTKKTLDGDTDPSDLDVEMQEVTSDSHKIEAEIDPHVGYFIGHMVGAFSYFFGNILFVTEMYDESNNTLLSRASTVMSTLGSVGPAAGALLLSREPIRSKPWRYFSYYIVLMHLSSKVIFCDFIQGSIEPKDTLAKMKVKGGNPKVFGAVTDVFFIIPQLAITFKHLDELTDAKPSNDRSCAIISEVTAMVSYANRAASLACMTTKEPNSKAIAAGVFAGTTIANAGLLVANASVGL